MESESILNDPGFSRKITKVTQNTIEAVLIVIIEGLRSTYNEIKAYATLGVSLQENIKLQMCLHAR